MDFKTLIELCEPTLGRLLARNWNLKALSDLEKIRTEGNSPDQYASRFFAAISRIVSDDVPATKELFDEAPMLEPEVFEQLSASSLDALAQSYLEQTQKWISPGDAGSETVVGDSIRATEQLQRCAQTALDRVAATSRTIADHFKAALSQAGMSPDLKKAFEHTALLSAGVGDAVTRLLKSQNADLAKVSKGLAGFDGGEAAAKNLSETLSFRVPGAPPRDGDSAAELVRRLSDPIYPNLDDLKPLPNPIFKTNEELAELRRTIKELVEVAKRQAELSQALTETSRLALQEAIASGDYADKALRQTRNGVLIAAASLVLSVVFGFVGMRLSVSSGKSTDAQLERLIDVTEKMNRATATTFAADASLREQELGALREIARQLQDLRKQMVQPSGSAKSQESR